MMKSNYVLFIAVTRFPLKLQFIVLTVCLSAGIVLSQEGKITCDVPSVQELGSTSLTCYFPEDVSLTRKYVSVYLQREDSSTVSVLICWWLQENINCKIAPGYTFTGTVSHVLTIHIPRATVNQTGTYSCQLSGYTRSQLETCDFKILSVSDNRVTCNVPSVKALTTTTLTCNFPEDINQTRKDFTVYLYNENENPDAILDCWWVKGQMDCYSAPGYKYTMSISRQLTVTIPRAAASQTGTYACHVDGYGPGQLSTCDFSIKSATKTICDAPSVREGSSAWLSCYFSENVGKSKKNFAVYHVSSKGCKDMILTCTWSQGSLICYSAPDYQFDKRVTNTATVNILKVSASHTGTYFCQIAGAAPGDYEECVFSLDQVVTDALQVTSCNIPPVKLMEPATITCNFTVDVNKTKSNFNIVHFSDENKAGADVLKCFWHNDDLLCDVTSGLEFSRPVTDRLALTISRTDVSHVGKYLCQLQTASNNSQLCELVIGLEFVVPD